MKLNLTVIIFLLTLVIAKSQDSFVELTNGKMIYGKVIYKEPVFKSPYLLVDSTSYSLDLVSAYQIDNNYFKKFLLPGFIRPTFFLRTAKGKIESYSKSSTYTTFQGGHMSTMSNRWDYYSIDNGPLKKVRYRFLKKDLAQSPEAMKIMKKVKELRTLSGVLYLGGSALIIGGVSSLSGSKGSGIPPGIIIGAISFTANQFLLFAKRDKLIDAINAYNEEMK